MANTTRIGAIYKRYWNNNIGYRVATSTPFMLLQTIFAAVCFNLDLPVLSLYVFASIILIALLTSKDMSPCLLPLLLVSMTLLKMYGTNLGDYKYIIPLAIILIVLIVFRPLYLPTKFHSGTMFWALMGVSIAITLGGLGSLQWQQYFDIIPLYYVIGLGLGMLIAYLYMRNYTYHDKLHCPRQVFTKTMLCVGLMGIMMVMPIVIQSITQDKQWSIQWSNNLSTFLIFAMPFAFFQAVKVERGGAAWFIIGALEGCVCMLTLSRGGILFGAVTMVISAITALIIAKNKRKLSLLIASGIIVIIAMILLFTEGTLAKLGELLEINANEARVNLIKVAIDNFINNPLFGAGLAYKGAYYNPQKWALYWYHSLPFQIIGSLGIVGIIAYGFLFYKRASICLRSKSTFNIFCLLSMFGFTLMGCVNPGEFAPVPYAVMITAVTVYIELNNSSIIFHHNGKEPPAYSDNLDKSQQNI